MSLSSLHDSSSFDPVLQQRLFYKISTVADGVTLRIWEESPSSPARGKVPYLYILNLRVASVAEAKRHLADHVALNGGILVADQTLPAKGKISLMPYPTWTGQEGYPL